MAMGGYKKKKKHRPPSTYQSVELRDLSSAGAGQDSVREIKPKGNLVAFLSTARILSVNYWCKAEGTGCQCIDVGSFHQICYTFLFHIIGWTFALVLEVTERKCIFFQSGEQFFFSIIQYFLRVPLQTVDILYDYWWDSETKLFSQNISGIYLFLSFVNPFQEVN